jgi:hypothetical protein
VSAPYLICTGAISSHHVAMWEWPRSRTTVRRRRARGVCGPRVVPLLADTGHVAAHARARGNTPLPATCRPGVGVGCCRAGGGHGGGLADRGLGRVASARWPGDVGSLVLAARPGLARFFLFCSVSVPNHMVQARFKALGSGFHSVFFSTTSGTFPACYSVVGVGLGAGKRGRSSTLPLLPL